MRKLEHNCDYTTQSDIDAGISIFTHLATELPIGFISIPWIPRKRSRPLPAKLQQIRAGGEIRKADLIQQFDCPISTAHRDLKALRQKGLVEFLGPAKTGFWRLPLVSAARS